MDTDAIDKAPSEKEDGDGGKGEKKKGGEELLYEDEDYEKKPKGR